MTTIHTCLLNYSVIRTKKEYRFLTSNRPASRPSSVCEMPQQSGGIDEIYEITWNCIPPVWFGHEVFPLRNQTRCGIDRTRVTDAQADRSAFAGNGKQRS